VIACNNDGIWNEEGATLGFSVAAAWYQTWWFRGASLAVFLALLWALYQLRLRQLAYQFNITVEARVNERTRIARDLHDTLLQSFQALLYRLQSVRRVLPGRPEEAAQRLDSAIDQTAEAITEGRDAVHELRSSTVVASDLAQAIGTLGEDLAAQANNHHAAVFGVQVEGTPRNLHPILRDEVFRIAGEAMRNAFRHAEAKQIEVEIRYDDRQFRMRVRDDGKGIDPKVLTQDGHYGLHGMRERAKLAGGRLDVWSELGSGTEVELSIPAPIAYSRATDRSGSGRSGTQAETES
jgi:signal transduction histidine kinase